MWGFVVRRLLLEKFSEKKCLFAQAVGALVFGEQAAQLVAKNGWAFQQHTLSLNDDQFTTATFEKVNAVTPIGDLRWSIGHVPKIDRPTLDFVALAKGMGVAARAVTTADEFVAALAEAIPERGPRLIEVQI